MKEVQEYIESEFTDSDNEEIIFNPMNNVLSIYSYIKEECKNTIFSLFDRLTEEDLLYFLYPEYTN